MESLSGLLPAIISFIVFVNIIESLINFFTKKGNKKEDSQKKDNKKSETGILNNDWKLQKKDKSVDKNKAPEVEEISSNNIENKTEENNSKTNNTFINKKGRMADYMDEEKSIYEKKSRTKVKRRNNINKDFPNEIKIGETKLFNKDNIKDDIIKGIVMKEILDKPRSLKPYKSPLEK